MPPRIKWDVDRATQLYREGWNLAEIGAELGVAPTSVGNQLRKRLKMRPAARRGQTPVSVSRLQPWRRVLLDALEQEPVIEVASVVTTYLGRPPTRTEAIAARRAAGTLASNGLAVRSYVKRDTDRGVRVHLLLGRREPDDQKSPVLAKF